MKILIIALFILGCLTFPALFQPKWKFKIIPIIIWILILILANTTL